MTEAEITPDMKRLARGRTIDLERSTPEMLVTTTPGSIHFTNVPITLAAERAMAKLNAEARK